MLLPLLLNLGTAGPVEPPIEPEAPTHAGSGGGTMGRSTSKTRADLIRQDDDDQMVLSVVAAMISIGVFG